MNMNQLFKFAMTVMVAAFASVVIPTAVFAVDSKVYPGSMCYPAFNSEAPNIIRDVNGVFNTSSLPISIKVTCPIVRDNVTNTNGTQAVFVSVFRDKLAAGSLDCTLFSFGRFDEFIETDSASFSGTGKATLKLDVDSSAPNGYYSIGCTLPNIFSGVFRYKVDEF